jgi:hypothetical protein
MMLDGIRKFECTVLPTDEQAGRLYLGSVCQ